MQRIHEFLRFCVVGGVGFIIDAGTLELLVMQGTVPEIARVFSILLALQITYFLHGFFTFRTARSYSLRGWLPFLACNLLGASINYLIFVGMLALALFGESTFLTRQSALVMGTAVALVCNYWMNRRFVFRSNAGDA